MRAAEKQLGLGKYLVWKCICNNICLPLYWFFYFMLCILMLRLCGMTLSVSQRVSAPWTAPGSAQGSASRLEKMSISHGLINNIETKAKCRHLEKLTCKGTLRQVFIGWRYSQSCWYFQPSFVNCRPSNLLSGLIQPPPPFPSSQCE